MYEEEIEDYTQAIKSPLIENFTNIQGIINIGNSCYSSSIIQCMIHTSKELLEEITNLKGKDYVSELQNITYRILNSDCAINPSNEFKILIRSFAKNNVSKSERLLRGR